ncbi:MAG TPA: DEAD/DEAH box helicase [Candidatus Pseudogracilibacillus intestinigallinarum]|uniref:ATP-dependent RNA helicase CshA n=1 Tax=Candidatus Pseudogracilibacillus intestinigallinarum TaxID=2838742 RepID=A0A9D1TKJ7_9BACI|nr:DEAD/DEAH box helicase [Candidatus Pseudogracilibacillus intestinigallinarum]
MTKFSELQVSDVVLNALESMGFEEATPIQAATIPHALQGKDVIGQAQTGTGKTAAFGIPMIENFETGKKGVQGLVVAPTRELAIQVAAELNRLGKSKGIRSLAVYGGQQMDRQIRALKDRPQIVVATPGRLLDHLNRRTIKLHDIKVAVLDEADEMLNMGFIDDIKDILKAIPEERQTLLFSATMPKEIREIATTLMNDPTEIKVKAKEMTVENIEQTFMEVPERFKFDTLTNHLDIYSPKLAIVFTRTKKRVDEITDGLQVRGFRAEGIHGDLTQGKRMSVLNKFKNERIEILVATDVAARGLDISGVTHVYNFDIPQDPESYVHRIGRTGRAGRTGEAISFVTPREMPHLRLIEEVTKSKMKRMVPPTNQEAARGKQQATAEKLLKLIENEDLQSFHQTATELLDDHDSISVVSAALKMLTKERKDVPVTISSVQPISVKNTRSKGPKGRKGGGKRFYGNRSKGGRGDSRRGGERRGGERRGGKGNFQKRRNRQK